MSPPGGLNLELQLSVNNRNPDIVIFAFVSAATSRDVSLRPAFYFNHRKGIKMSGSSNLVTMKKVVQQLRFEASINRVKVSKSDFFSPDN